MENDPTTPPPVPPTPPVPPAVPEPGPYQAPAGLGAPPVPADPVYPSHPAPQGIPQLIERIKALILNPKGTWPLIAGDQGDPASLTKSLLIPLAAIPAVAGFIGNSLIGIKVPYYGTLRVPMATGIVSAVLTYIMAIVGVYLLAFVIDKLAKTFQGQENFNQSFKLAAWSAVPGMLASVFTALPLMSVLAILGFIYGLVLLFFGLRVMKRNPEQKTIPYFVVSLIVAVVVNLIVGFVVHLATPEPATRGTMDPDRAAENVGKIMEEAMRKARENR